MRQLVGHHKLEMDPKELPAEQFVVLGLDDLAEPDWHDHGVAPGGSDIDAVASDRVEWIEIHHILARLAVDPVDRRFGRQQAQVLAEILRHGMKADDREIAADRYQDDAPTMPPERRIELECARQNLGAQER